MSDKRGLDELIILMRQPCLRPLISNFFFVSLAEQSSDDA